MTNGSCFHYQVYVLHSSEQLKSTVLNSRSESLAIKSTTLHFVITFKITNITLDNTLYTFYS